MEEVKAVAVQEDEKQNRSMSTNLALWSIFPKQGTDSKLENNFSVFL